MGACWHRNVVWHAEAGHGYALGDCGVVVIRVVVVVVRVRHNVVLHRAYGLAPTNDLLGRRRSPWYNCRCELVTVLMVSQAIQILPEEPVGIGMSPGMSKPLVVISSVTVLLKFDPWLLLYDPGHIVVRHPAYGLAPADNLLGRRRRCLLAAGVKRVGGVVVRHLEYNLPPSKSLLGRCWRADRGSCGLRSSRGFRGGLGLGLEELEGHSGSTLGNLRA